VVRPDDVLLEVDGVVAEGAGGLAAGALEGGATPASSSTRRMPLPPPPAEALIITGKPMRAMSTASSGSRTGSTVPGTTGTPAAVTVRRARSLSPMAVMAAGGGPIQTSPASCTLRAKVAFSLRNP
jgi:hypothetical protein